MQSPIFKKSDFKLCTVPVPDGYPQSQTHAGIAYCDGRFYLTCSPYPVVKCSRFKAHLNSFLRKVSSGRLGKVINGEKYENPLLYVGDSNSGMPPTRFMPLKPFPLMDTPKPVFGLPAYNSDPDIFIEENKVFILNRAYYRKPTTDGQSEKEVLVSLIEGTIENGDFRYANTSEFIRSGDSLISPCLTKYQGKYCLFSLETNSAIDGHSFEGLYVRMSDTIQGLKRECTETKVNVVSNNLLPWHMSVFSYNERLFAIIACVEVGDKSHIWQMLGEFNNDLSELSIFNRPLTDYNSYRGAAHIFDGNTFVLYSTTLREKINNSKSIDGRDIIMLLEPQFSEILNNIR